MVSNEIRRDYANVWPDMLIAPHSVSFDTHASVYKTCTVRMSCPFCSKCVAKECRSVCGVAGRTMPALRAACLIVSTPLHCPQR